MKARYRETSYSASLLIGDIFMILTGLRFSFWLKFESGVVSSGGVPDFQVYAQVFALAAILTLFMFRVYGLYVEERIFSFLREFGLVAKAVTVTTMVLVSLSFFYRDFSFSRMYLLVAWFHVLVFVMSLRFLQGYVYMSYRRANGKLKDVLAIGANPTTAKLAIRYLREPRWCTRVLGILDDQRKKGQCYKRMPILGQVHEIETVLESHPEINEVLVTESRLSPDKVLKIMALSEKFLMNFKWSPDTLGLMATQMKMDYEFGLPLLSIKDLPLSDWENRLIKRAMDMVVSLVFLILMMPVVALIAIVIGVDSRGPIFYKQKRVGEDGRPFTLYKFRTMIPDAERATGPVWARADDRRRTRVGTFLRSLNLDELPQIWNVLRGDMSLVGPRPERPHFVGRFRDDIPRYMGRHQIKSGVTGWAQVHGLRGDTSIEERTKYDLFYIENWSVMLDLKILFRTLTAFRNAY